MAAVLSALQNSELEALRANKTLTVMKKNSLFNRSRPSADLLRAGVLVEASQRRNKGVWGARGGGRGGPNEPNMTEQTGLINKVYNKSDMFVWDKEDRNEETLNY